MDTRCRVTQLNRFYIIMLINIKSQEIGLHLEPACCEMVGGAPTTWTFGHGIGDVR